MTEPRRVRSLVGVYDADGTIAGEVSYWFGARFRRSHCDLCEITHGTFRRKRDWDRFVESCAVPFLTYHRDDAPADVLLTMASLASVAAIVDDGVVIVLGPEELAACDGDVDAFARVLDRSLIDAGFEPVSGTGSASRD